MMYNTVKVASLDNTGRFNSWYILLEHRNGLMLLAKGNFATLVGLSIFYAPPQNIVVTKNSVDNIEGVRIRT